MTWGTALGSALLVSLTLVAATARWLAPADPFAVTHAALAAPSADHPFGTDDLGRDVYAGVVHGAATSLRMGFAAAACSTMIGLAVGGLAGMRSGAIDVLAMRLTEMVQAIPRFFLAALVISLFGGQLSLIILVLGLTSWPATALTFRAQVMSHMTREFVLAARAAGSSDLRILVHHVAPLALSVIAAQVSYQAGGAILAEAGLSFLGLGDPTVMSWGAMLGAAHQTMRGAWWSAVFPGLAVTTTVLACNLLSDGLVEKRRQGAGRDEGRNSLRPR